MLKSPYNYRARNEISFYANSRDALSVTSLAISMAVGQIGPTFCAKLVE